MKLFLTFFIRFIENEILRENWFMREVKKISLFLPFSYNKTKQVSSKRDKHALQTFGIFLLLIYSKNSLE